VHIELLILILTAAINVHLFIIYLFIIYLVMLILETHFCELLPL
jgi:hypothetical protein